MGCFRKKKSHPAPLSAPKPAPPPAPPSAQPPAPASTAPTDAPKQPAGGAMSPQTPLVTPVQMHFETQSNSQCAMPSSDAAASAADARDADWTSTPSEARRPSTEGGKSWRYDAAPSLPAAHARVLWGGAAGAGSYGNYTPVSVLDNRTSSRSMNSLLEGSLPRGYGASRPVTPSCGYGAPARTVDRLAGPQYHYRPQHARPSAPRMHGSQDSFTSRLSEATLGKTLCEACGKKCSGEVLRVQDKYYHVTCFSCKGCGVSLAKGGFFTRGGQHHCTACYQSNFGQKCFTCNQYVEGEVVTALGNTYHQACFTCARCRLPFPSGERVTFTGQECLCQRCFSVPSRGGQSPAASPRQPGPECAGCSQELSEGQALIALDRQWHIWCFKCATCGTLLHGEYMGKDGLPYCEQDYQATFGVSCAYCQRFISGKVLQAGDKHHFHPTCARCTKCGDPFGDGEEMYLQGTAIWHPRCGPGPTEGTVLNGDAASLGGQTATESCVTDSCVAATPDGRSSSASGQYQRTVSPGLLLRDYRPRTPPHRILTYSYLAAEPSQGLKRPIDPYDRPPKSPHFHRPQGLDGAPAQPYITPSRTGMRSLLQQMTPSPRSRSPHMNNEEPITLAHFPGGRKPRRDQPRRIERDDFPAPSYPYTDSERRRKWSGSSRGVEEEELEDGGDELDGDPKLKREEEELAKISTGLAGVFLAQVRRREANRRPLDPRQAARTPSASREPRESSRADYASPRWTADDYEAPSHCSSSRSSANLPSYSVASALRQPPKPGYGFGYRGGHYRAGLGSHSALQGVACGVSDADLSSARSDVSASSLSEADRNALSGGPEPYPPHHHHHHRYPPRPSPHLRRSLPSLPHHTAPSEPPKLYPAHLLTTTNYRLPADVDRCHLERHMSDADFEGVFRMSRPGFYRLPEWQRNELKRLCRLF